MIEATRPTLRKGATSVVDKFLEPNDAAVLRLTRGYPGSRYPIGGSDPGTHHTSSRDGDENGHDSAKKNGRASINAAAASLFRSADSGWYTLPAENFCDLSSHELSTDALVSKAAPDDYGTPR